MSFQESSRSGAEGGGRPADDGSSITTPLFPLGSARGGGILSVADVGRKVPHSTAGLPMPVIAVSYRLSRGAESADRAHSGE